jgi:putative ABC transport system substrate-binding protein
MKRREFIAAIGAAAAAWPLPVRAQSGRARRVGVLMNAVPKQTIAADNLQSLNKGLAALGWIEGANLHADVRWGGETPDGYETAAAELLASGPEVLVASTTPALAALWRRTSDIPIVFVVVTDPVGQGFVSSLSRPGGNVTGFSNYDAPMAGKWLGLLKQLAPGMDRAALVFNPETAPYAPLLLSALSAAAGGVGVEAAPAPVHSDEEIDRTLAALGARPGSGLVVLPDSFTASHRMRIVEDAAREHLPAIYPYASYARAGGLIGYGIVLTNLFQRAAGYVDRILKGATPAELPVQAPDQFEMTINLKAAKALGLAVPDSLLHLADEVIE